MSVSPPFLVTTSPSAVEAWSAKRLQCHGLRPAWQDQMCREIIAGINQIEDEPGEVLHATYTSTEMAFVDCENVLFYNVSTTPFGRLTRTGLRFERSFLSPPPRPNGDSADHHHLYRMEPASQNFAHWTIARTLARFETACIRRVNTSTRCRDVWAGVHSGDQVALASSRPQEPIAVKLKLAGRPAEVSSAVGAVKPLFDGVIAAFQGHDGTAEEDVTRRLVGAGGTPSGLVVNWLRNPGHSILGSSQLARPWGQSVQFYPADDLCVAGELLVTVSPDGPSPPVLSGELLGMAGLDQAV